MGMKITRGGDLSVKLAKAEKETTRQLRRLQREAAYEIADVAEQMAPVLSGKLESSINVEERYEGRRKSFIIAFKAMRIGKGPSFDYGRWIHEAVYNLGKLSRAKNAGSKYRVGRKFLTRALNTVMREGNFKERAEAAVRRAMLRALK